ncbi:MULTISPECIES: cupin domain-containing protein [Rhizobium]|uniref:Quercetin dioxygenase-like cupin family protein n=1 Tax=Rhizobium miluonense TaxID=411945 RepID=A0ABU1SX24_9HYPH|nr:MULTISPECIES: cupin domain-containing protein [Rhizobium]MBB3428864.1 quercetin dioxygenase-like cupin family protein [Rhizobium sp. BK312]MDR6903509.1 quercetin dioxygenase-like cupin family protein [Rhizobium miluonense]
MRYVQKLKLDVGAEDAPEARTSVFGSLSAIGTCRIDHVLLSAPASPVGLHSQTVERLIYVLAGAISLKEGADFVRLEANDFLFVPRSRAIIIMGTDSAARLLDIQVPISYERSSPAADKALSDLKGRVDENAFAVHTAHAAEGRAFETQALIDRKIGSESIKAFISLVHPGSGMGLHVHPFDQFYYVLQGELSVLLGFDSGRMSEGDLVAFPAGLIHSNSNDGASPTLLLTINVPEVPVGTRGAYSIDLNS